MSYNPPLPTPTISDINAWQTNEVIAQLKRIADALETANGTNQAWMETMIRWRREDEGLFESSPDDRREHMPKEVWICEECHSNEDITKFIDVTGQAKEPIYLCSKCFYAGIGPRELREWTPEDGEVRV